MKLGLLLCMPMLTLCSAGSQKKLHIVHSELNAAVHDLTMSATPESRTAILRRIDMALSGGSDLNNTRYSLADITAAVPKKTLEQEAVQNRWYGILKLLGLWGIVIKGDEE